MYLHFVAVKEKVLNLNNVVLIEDVSDAVTGPKVIVHTIDGTEFTFTGSDADAVFERCDQLVAANAAVIAQINQHTQGA